MNDPGQPSIWEWTAHHEAGHAVAAIILNIGLSRIEMDNQVFPETTNSTWGALFST
jgi:hypothetical protein